MPDVSGVRVVKALFDDLRLQWTEVLVAPGAGEAAPSADIYPRHGRPRSFHVDGAGPRVARGLHAAVITSSITSSDRL